MLDIWCERCERVGHPTREHDPEHAERLTREAEARAAATFRWERARRFRQEAGA